MMSLALNNWAQYLMVQCFNILNFFFLIFPRKQLRHFMHIVSLGCFLRKKKNNNKQKTSVFAYRVVKVNLIVFFIVSDCGEEDQVCKKDVESLEAIEALHKQIDDDQSGNIDQSESDEVSIALGNSKKKRYTIWNNVNTA